MPIQNRATVVLLGTLAAILAGSLPIGAQEPAKTTATTAVEKKKAGPTRRVPDYFGQIGLTPDQRAGIYAVQDKHMTKIEALEKQIEAIKAEMMTESEAVLDDTQKKLLANLRRAAVGATAKPTEAAKTVK